MPGVPERVEQVGITTPGLTHHFPTKQHLLLAIVERRFDVAQPGLMELFVLVSAEAADRASAAHDLFQKRYTRITNEIAAFFAAEVDSGALRPDLDYHAGARECIAVSDGL